MPPEAIGERSRDWPLGHAGDEGPHLRDDGGVSGWFWSGGPRVRFLTRYDGEVSEPLVGRQGSRVSMRVARGSASLLWSHGRGIWPRDVLKKVSRGLSRVKAGNRGFHRLVQVTSRSEEHTSELQSPLNLVCRLLLEKKKYTKPKKTKK